MVSIFSLHNAAPLFGELTPCLNVMRNTTACLPSSPKWGMEALTMLWFVTWKLRRKVMHSMMMLLWGYHTIDFVTHFGFGACSCSCHCCGVSALVTERAWISFISSARAPFTRRWRSSSLLPSKAADAISTMKLAPQPPDVSRTDRKVGLSLLCRAASTIFLETPIASESEVSRVYAFTNLWRLIPYHASTSQMWNFPLASSTHTSQK